jgi:dihydroflavonol-4-reductase
MTALVTGGTGFLGLHLVELLAASGRDVRALVRPGTDDTHLRALGVHVAPGHILDAAAVRAAAAGCETVFHLAGIVAHERRDLPRLRAVNVEGTRILLDAVEPGARVVRVGLPSRPACVESASELVGERLQPG